MRVKGVHAELKARTLLLLWLLSKNHEGKKAEINNFDQKDVNGCETTAAGKVIPR